MNTQEKCLQSWKHGSDYWSQQHDSLSLFLSSLVDLNTRINQPDYFHCSRETMKQQHQQSLYCNSSVEMQITKNLQFMKTPILHFNI